MALVPCKECGAEVSSKAFKCPKCGARLRKAKRGFFGFIIKWAFILFNLAMFLWLIYVFAFYSDGVNTSKDTAEQAANVVAGGIWATGTIITWVIVDFILGIFVLLTRPRE